MRSAHPRTRTPMRRPRDSDVDLLIGTSGWTYDSWEGPFYPPELSRTDWLAWYGTQFATAEINGSFIGRPRLRLSENGANEHRRILCLHGRPPSSSRTGNGLRKPAQTRLRSWVASAGARTQTRAGPVPTAGALRG